MLHRIPILPAILIMVLVIAPGARANMITNASFESGPEIPTGRLQLAVGSTTLTGWQVIGAPVDVVTEGWWDAYEGQRTMALNSFWTNMPGGIEQTFVTEPGAVYDVRFQLSAEPFTTPLLKQIRVTASGHHQEFSYDSENWHWDMMYAQHSWSFVAEGTSTTIQITSLTDGAASPVLDEVVVTRSTTDIALWPGRSEFGIWGPNPVRGMAQLAFAVPAAGPVEVTVTDARGRHVATMVRGTFRAGEYPAHWNTAGAPPGVYFVTLRAAGRTSTHKVALLR